MSIYQRPVDIEPDLPDLPCLGSIVTDNRWLPEQSVEPEALKAKTHWIDQSTLLVTGALSFLASFALNSFVQSIFNLSLPPPSPNNHWISVLYNLVYVVLVVAIALAVMFPLSRAKSLRDDKQKALDRLIPTLVRCVNCNRCGGIKALNQIAMVARSDQSSLLSHKPISKSPY